MRPCRSGSCTQPAPPCCPCGPRRVQSEVHEGLDLHRRMPKVAKVRRLVLIPNGGLQLGVYVHTATYWPGQSKSKVWVSNNLFCMVTNWWKYNFKSSKTYYRVHFLSPSMPFIFRKLQCDLKHNPCFLYFLQCIHVCSLQLYINHVRVCMFFFFLVSFMQFIVGYINWTVPFQSLHGFRLCWGTGKVSWAKVHYWDTLCTSITLPQ